MDNVEKFKKELSELEDDFKLGLINTKEYYNGLKNLEKRAFDCFWGKREEKPKHSVKQSLKNANCSIGSEKYGFVSKTIGPQDIIMN